MFLALIGASLIGIGDFKIGIKHLIGDGLGLLAAILAQVEQGLYSSSALRDRLKIMIEERKSYDPVSTKATLKKLAPERNLVIDTTYNSPEQIAKKVKHFLLN